jgi:hypothetical protein
MGMVMHPLVLLPTVAGLTAWGLLAVLGKSLSWLCGPIGAIMSAGFLFSRLILSGDKVAEKALREVEQEANENWTRMLDELDDRLSQDKDPRDEKLLRSLRELFVTIRDDDSWRSKFDSVTVSKLHGALDESFNKSVEKLNEAMTYQQKARETNRDKVRMLLLKEREQLLEEVKCYVEEFESIFQELRQVQKESADPNHCLTRLKQTLEIGKKVRSTMQSRGLSLDQ